MSTPEAPETPGAPAGGTGPDETQAKLEKRAMAAGLARQTAERDLAAAATQRAAAEIALLQETRAKERAEIALAAQIKLQAETERAARQSFEDLAAATAKKTAAEQAAVEAAKERILQTRRLEIAAQERAAAHLSAEEAAKRRIAIEAEEFMTLAATEKEDALAALTAAERVRIARSALADAETRRIEEEANTARFKKFARLSKSVHYYDGQNRAKGRTVIQGNVAFHFDNNNTYQGKEVTVAGVTRVYDANNNEVSKFTKY